jgi:hypothetical protein
MLCCRIHGLKFQSAPTLDSEVASSLVKVATYNRWFMTGPLLQEEFDAGSPQGMPMYIRHTSAGIPFAYVKHLMRFRTGAHLQE